MPAATAEAKDALRARITDALTVEQQNQLVEQWPAAVASLRKPGHTDLQLTAIHHLIDTILAAGGTPPEAAPESQAGAAEDPAGGTPSEQIASATGPPSADVHPLHGALMQACSDAFGNEEPLRHAIVAYATEGKKNSSRDLDGDEHRAVIDACAKVELGELVAVFNIDGSATWAPKPADKPAADLGSFSWAVAAKQRGVTQRTLLTLINEWSISRQGPRYTKLSDIPPAYAALFLTGNEPIPVRPDTPPAAIQAGAVALAPVQEIVPAPEHLAQRHDPLERIANALERLADWVLRP